MRFHLEARTADLTARGVRPAEARRQAQLEFGAVEAYREQTRRAAGISWLADLYGRHPLRHPARAPAAGVRFAALASLALGIGVNTLVFSVASGLVLRPLPIDRPDALAFVMNGSGPGLSYPAYRDLRDRATTLSGVAGYRIAPMSLEHDRTASRAWGYLVTGDYYDVLGVHPAAGRVFKPADARPPAQSPVAVLSYAYWMSRFGGSPAVIGSIIRVNGLPYTVFGVTPAGFFGTEIFYRPDLFVPMTMQPQIEARSSWLEERSVQDLFVVGRLRPQVPPAQAQADLTTLSAALAREYPATDEGMALRLTPPGLLGDTLRGPMKAFSFGILFLAMLVLLMACVNLAVMLTARGADRRRELAIRLSIGAGAGRIVRQLLTETLLSSLVGGAIGLGLALAASRVLSAWRPPVDVPIQFDVTPDLRVFLFALAVATIAGVSFGLAPALQASRTDAQAALKGLDGRPGRRRAWAMRDVLVAAQVAVCFVLVAGCLLALRGLQSALTMPIGFRPEGVTMVGYDVGLAGYTPARGAEFEGRAIEAVRRLPGVDRAAYADTIPLYLNQSNSGVVPEDHPDLPVSERQSASRFEVSNDFFTTLGIRLVAGRPLEVSDTAASPLVAVVNETFARKVFHTTSPLGRRFRDGGHKSGWVEVVGVAEDGKYQSLSERRGHVRAHRAELPGNDQPRRALGAAARRGDRQRAAGLHRTRSEHPALRNPDARRHARRRAPAEPGGRDCARRVRRARRAARAHRAPRHREPRGRQAPEGDRHSAGHRGAADRDPPAGARAHAGPARDRDRRRVGARAARPAGPREHRLPGLAVRSAGAHGCGRLSGGRGSAGLLGPGSALGAGQSYPRAPAGLGVVPFGY